MTVKGCGIASAHLLWFPGVPQWSELPAGDHALQISAVGDDGPSEVRLEWQAVDPPIARECADASPLTLDPVNGARLRLSLATGLTHLSCGEQECVGWVRLSSDRTRYLDAKLLETSHRRPMDRTGM